MKQPKYIGFHATFNAGQETSTPKSTEEREATTIEGAVTKVYFFSFSYPDGNVAVNTNFSIQEHRGMLWVIDMRLKLSLCS